MNFETQGEAKIALARFLSDLENRLFRKALFYMPYFNPTINFNMLQYVNGGASKVI